MRHLFSWIALASGRSLPEQIPLYFTLCVKNRKYIMNKVNSHLESQISHLNARDLFMYVQAGHSQAEVWMIEYDNRTHSKWILQCPDTIFPTNGKWNRPLPCYPSSSHWFPSLLSSFQEPILLECESPMFSCEESKPLTEKKRRLPGRADLLTGPIEIDYRVFDSPCQPLCWLSCSQQPLVWEWKESSVLLEWRQTWQWTNSSWELLH